MHLREPASACVRHFVLAVLSWLGIASAGASLGAQTGDGKELGTGPSRPASADAIRAVLKRLDDYFDRADLAGYLAMFDADHPGAQAMLQRQLQQLFGARPPFRRKSTLVTEPRLVGPRTVVRVRHELHLAGAPGAVGPAAAPKTLVLDTMLALRSDPKGLVPTFAVEMPAQTACVRGDLFHCQACNYEIGAVPGWLCVPLRSDRAESFEAASFYLLGTDMACDVTVHIDADAPDALSVARVLGETLHELDATAQPGLPTPWLPPAHRGHTPKGLAGASVEIDLPADAVAIGGARAVFHVVAFGGLQHLLLVRGSRRAWQQHADDVHSLLASYRLLESDCDLALAAARPLLHHTGGSLQGSTYHNKTFALDLQGPATWKAQLRCGGAAFRVVWVSPDGSHLWLTGYAVPDGVTQWCRESADRWLHELCTRAGLDVRPAPDPASGATTANGEWCERAGCGGQTRFVVGTPHEPSGPDAPRQRFMRLLVDDDLLVVADGHATTDADLQALRQALDSLRRP
ncbi:MAG TPA: hypothetical protein VFZ65_10410 [Planctomycetota bacterium]|nr:hypothetical protein [Planctomycetota bacterium]